MAAADAPIRKRDRLKARAKRYMTVPLAVRTADLPRRAASAVIMLAVAGFTLWLGGVVWDMFVAAVAIGVLIEWVRLTLRLSHSLPLRTMWIIAGIAYIGFAALTLSQLRDTKEFGLPDAGIFYVGLVLGTVIAIDVGAYFVGRTLGGPKIAPRISPSKTWAGLAGGAAGAAAFITVWYSSMAGYYWGTVTEVSWIAGLLCAVLAQAGDFFESWMKRRAGVKDSGSLIPGHGGLFDRVDGLMPLLIVVGLLRI